VGGRGPRGAPAAGPPANRLTLSPSIAQEPWTADPRARSELANLDCLRSFAVIAVIVDHLAGILAAAHGARISPFFEMLGHLGVLAFFVHTSLVLMFSMQRLAPKQSGLALRFYIRRAFRIYPLSILCVLGVLWFRIPPEPLGGPPYQIPSASVIVGNLLLVQNLVGKMSVSGPLWSLPFEIQMYLVLPILFRLAVLKKALLYLGGLLLLSSGVGWLVLTLTGHANILAYVPCFLSGIIAFALRSRLRPFLPAAAWPWFVGLWLALATWSMLHWSAVARPVSWLACLLLGLSVYSFHDSRNRIWNRVTNTIAKYSFGIYLSHAPLGWLVFSVWHVGSGVPACALWLALTFVVSTIGYHLLEYPMIQAGRRLSDRTSMRART
jgi:peptidoglycan/LPS O-acetylase OafA/YrhL